MSYWGGVYAKAILIFISFISISKFLLCESDFDKNYIPRMGMCQEMYDTNNKRNTTFIPIGFLMINYIYFSLTYTWVGYIMKTKSEGIQMEEGKQPFHRTKERTPEEYKKLINRLNRLEGQVRGIRGMVEKNVYCTDILVQTAAITAAINAFNKELLANHIKSCVVNDIREGKDEVIDDLVATIQKLMK